MLRISLLYTCFVVVTLGAVVGFLPPHVQAQPSAQSFSMIDSLTRREIIGTIQELFSGMSASDTARLRLLFHDTNERMQTVARLKDTTWKVQYETITGFLATIGKPKPQNFTFEERILSYDIRRDGDFANVWCPYEVYINGQFRHCGVDVFNLVRTPTGWKFLQIADTRRTDGCR
jgi:hypothetical protein